MTRRWGYLRPALAQWHCRGDVLGDVLQLPIPPHHELARLICAGRHHPASSDASTEVNGLIQEMCGMLRGVEHKSAHPCRGCLQLQSEGARLASRADAVAAKRSSAAFPETFHRRRHVWTLGGPALCCRHQACCRAVGKLSAEEMRRADRMIPMVPVRRKCHLPAPVVARTHLARPIG